MSLDTRNELSPVEQEELEGLVQRGARKLDRIEPGWYRRISKEKLEMNNVCNCILGQLYGSYQVTPITATESGTDLGFNLKLFFPEEGWKYLEYLWIEEINFRLEYGVD